jgi:hypothetical protein
VGGVFREDEDQKDFQEHCKRPALRVRPVAVLKL